MTKIGSHQTRSPKQKDKNAKRITGMSLASWSSIVALAALFVTVSLAWGVPAGVGIAYLVISALTWLVYVIDKRASRGGARRVSENTLHWLGFLGGWPGAIIAQQMHRHKSTKASFRVVFWITAALNVCAFFGLAAPVARPYWLALGRALGMG
jgi:uncharacterized membrane protein YsdA (DUF1294 family)